MDDTAAQWIMALLTVAAVVLLWKTLIQTNKTNQAAVIAANAANEANRIMREEQRAWIQIKPDLKTNLSFEKSSNTLMVGIELNAKNVSPNPAMDFAVEGMMKIVRKGSKMGFSSEDYLEDLKVVTIHAATTSNKRCFTETIFSGQGATLNSNRYLHAKLGPVDVPDDAAIGLVACLAVSYRTPSGHGGASWSGVIIQDVSQSMFGTFIADAKAGPVPVRLISQPVSYY